LHNFAWQTQAVDSPRRRRPGPPPLSSNTNATTTSGSGSNSNYAAAAFQTLNNNNNNNGNGGVGGSGSREESRSHALVIIAPAPQSPTELQFFFASPRDRSSFLTQPASARRATDSGADSGAAATAAGAGKGRSLGPKVAAKMVRDGLLTESIGLRCKPDDLDIALTWLDVHAAAAVSSDLEKVSRMFFFFFVGRGCGERGVWRSSVFCDCLFYFILYLLVVDSFLPQFDFVWPRK
jgi:hypothetical protein